MTVDEIKKALRECRLSGKCDDCPLKDNPDCITLLKRDALNAIEELEERIAIMQESMEALEKRCNALNALEQRCKALEVLEQRNEPQPPNYGVIGDFHTYTGYKCPNCDGEIKFLQNFCGYCGQAVKWDA